MIEVDCTPVSPTTIVITLSSDKDTIYVEQMLWVLRDFIQRQIIVHKIDPTTLYGAMPASKPPLVF